MFAKLIFLHFDQVLEDRELAAYRIEDDTIMAGKFCVERIGFTIPQLYKTRIAWEFDSLERAIETIYGLALTDEDSLIVRCKHGI